MGYQPTTVTPPQIEPRAAAVLPSTRILFSLKPVIRSTRNGSVLTRLAWAQA